MIIQIPDYSAILLPKLTFKCLITEVQASPNTAVSL